MFSRTYKRIGPRPTCLSLILFMAGTGSFLHAVAQAKLEANLAGDRSLALSWAATETGYSLETTPALGATENWVAVVGTPSLANGRFSLTVSPGDQARFYRLRRAQGTTVTRVSETSPLPGEAGVAVTREVVFRFSGPLAADLELSDADLRSEAGERSLLVRTEISSDRRTATLFYLENLPGSTRVRATLKGERLLDASGKALDVDGDGQPGGVLVLEYDTAGTYGLTNTGVIGRVFASEKNSDESNRPLENVTITVDGAEETLRAVTDATGAFVLSPAPTGRFFVHVDGRTAVGSQWPGGAYYPFVGKAWEASAGVTTNLAGGTGEIYLPLIQSDALKSVSATTETKVTFSPSVLAARPDLAGVEVQVPANGLFSDSGARGGRVGIAPVAPDRLPEPLPPGLNFPLVITVQTDGPSNFDRPVPVRFPNLPDPVTGVKLGPGAKTVLWSFNHDTGRWEPQGLMTISADGQFAVSDPGTGIRQPGWHGASPGTEGDGPRRRRGRPDNGGGGDGDGDGDEDCEGDDCECTQEIVCVVQKEGKNVALCALDCLGNVVDDIFGDGPKPERTAFETGLRCIGGPDKCPGRPEDTLDRKRLDCMDECTDPEDDRIVYVMPCEGFMSPCGSSPALHAPSLHADIANLIPDRMVEQRKFWEVEGDFFVKLTGTPKILESDSSEVRRITDFFDAFADRVRTGSASGIALSAAERSELVALPRPAQFSVAEWTAMIDRLASFQGKPWPADVVAADQRLQALTAELIRRGWTSRGDGLLHGLARRSKHASVEVGSAEFPARSHFYYLKDHSNGFVQRGRLNAQGRFDGLILSPGGYYSVAYFDPVTRRAGVAFFQARRAGMTTVVPTARLESVASTESDLDRDGLPDFVEKILGTSDTKADSDGDGTSDGQEIGLGTNPLDGVGLPIGVVSVTPAPGVAWDVVAGNGLAVVAAGQGLAIYDVSNPSSPVRVAVVAGNAEAVAMEGTLVLASMSDGVRLIDLANPAQPTTRWIRSDLNGGGAVALNGEWAFATKGSDLYRLDLSTGEGASVTDRRIGLLDSVVPRGDLVYTLSGGSLGVFRAGEFLQLLNVVGAPGTGGAGGRPRRLFLDGPRLYAQHNTGFNVFDLTDPTAPVLAADKKTRQAGWRQFVPTGTGLALAADGPNSTSDGPHDVSLYRMTSDGLDAQFISTFVTPGSAYAVAIAGGRAYVADGTAGLVVINFLAPDLAGIAPTAVASIDTTAAPPKVEGGAVVRIAATAGDDIGVRRVELIVDGTTVVQDDSYPYDVYLRIPPFSPTNTSFKVRVRAEDMAGNSSESAETTVAIVADLTPPGIASLDPAPGAVVPIASIAEISVVLTEATVTPVSASTLTVVESGFDGLFGTADDLAIAGAVEWVAAEKTIRWKVGEPLVSGRFRMTLAPGLADAAGNSRVAPLTWEFATGSPPQVIEVFPPNNLVRVGGTLDELVFKYDQPVARGLFEPFRWTLVYRTVSRDDGALGPIVEIAPLTATLSPDGRRVSLRGPDTLKPGFYRLTGNGEPLPGVFWEFYFRDVPNEAIAVGFNGEVQWKYHPGVGVGDRLIVNVPGQMASLNVRNIESLIAYSDVRFLRQRVEVPTPIQIFGALEIVNTRFGRGVTDVLGRTTFTASFTDPLDIGPHTLNLRGGGFSRTRVELTDPQGAIVNHAGSTLLVTNGAGFYGPSGLAGGRLVNLGTLRSVASKDVVAFEDMLLRNDGRLEVTGGTVKVENLENEGTTDVAAGAKLHLPARIRAGATSRFSGEGAVELGEYNTSSRRVVSFADAEIRGEFEVRGPVTLTAGALTLVRPWDRPTGVVEVLNAGTLRLTASSRIGELALTDGNLSFNSDSEIGRLTVGSRADFRTATRVRVTGEAQIGQGLDALGQGVVEFAGSTVVTNGSQSGGVYVGNATLRNSGTWRQSIASTQGSFVSRVNESGVPGTGVFENLGEFELVGDRPLGIHVPFRNAGRVILSRGPVSIDADPAFTPARSGAYLPQAGGELVLNNTTLSHGTAGTLDLVAGTVRGTGSIQAVGTSPRPKVINRAVLRPGNPSGTLVIRATDGFEQTATGELVVSLGGGGTSLLRLDRTAAALAGTLTVELIDGFSPELGQQFRVLDYTSRTGEFTTVRLPTLGGGKRLEVIYGATGLDLRVVSQ
ncbi:MAG: hypothetical protein JNK85_12295 [Verrucomicrobiales bacterium]|nr:hypothetical protein [Verrucomicrobiales bacterium]